MNKLMLIAVGALAAHPAFAAERITAATYVAEAGASDLYEVQSSLLVLGETRDARLKAFAQMMVDDHGRSIQDVVAAAKVDGLTPVAPKLMAKQADMIASLTKASGAARDTLYRKQQVLAHEEALALQRTYAATGDRTHLKAAAAEIVPVVEKHLAELKSMAR
ncbi:MAG: DUF4142 domain-containing protein [Janthinobacterium lividum]